MTLEQRIRDADAGPWLDALCFVAKTDGTYNLDNLVEFARDDMLPDDLTVSRSWSAAGPALEWLRARGAQPLLATPVVWTKTADTWTVVLDFGNEWEGGDTTADSAPLAIARAVCLVGLRERSEEMEAAAAALEVGDEQG